MSDRSNQVKVTESFITLSNVPVNVLCIGKDLYEDPKDLILIIPGNPGGVRFYTEFATTIYTKLRDESQGRELSIWVLGHAGSSSSTEAPPLKGNELVYSLEGEISQKKQFVDRYIPKGCNLTLMGHSIGAKMALETFKYIENNSVKNNINVKYFYGLFPVIERMIESPAGPSHSKMFTDYRSLIVWIIYLVSFLPSFLTSMISYFCVPWDSSEEIFRAVRLLVNPIVAEKILYLGECELKYVRDVEPIDLDFIAHNSGRIRLYYGSADKWCPLKYCYELKAKIQSLQAYICQKKIPHSFTLGREKDMAGIIVDWLKEV